MDESANVLCMLQRIGFSQDQIKNFTGPGEASKNGAIEIFMLPPDNS
jgi:hypothetical protein